VLQLVRALFEYANAEEICEHKLCNGLSKALPPRPTRHHASITDPKQVGELLRAIDGFSGTFPLSRLTRARSTAGVPVWADCSVALEDGRWSSYHEGGGHQRRAFHYPPRPF
jgi:hypothetical protein